MREPDLTLYPKQPIVYAWRDDKGSIIYIGMSKVGLSRPLSLSHNAYTYGTSLSVWNCDTTAEARKLEAELIRCHKPILNRLIPVEWEQPAPFSVQNLENGQSPENGQEEPVKDRARFGRLAAAIEWAKKVKPS